MGYIIREAVDAMLRPRTASKGALSNTALQELAEEMSLCCFVSILEIT